MIQSNFNLFLLLQSYYLLLVVVSI